MTLLYESARGSSPPLLYSVHSPSCIRARVTLPLPSCIPFPPSPVSELTSLYLPFIGLYQIFVYFEAFAHESNILLPLPYLHCQHYCNTIRTTIAQCTTLPRPPFCMPYAIQYRYWQYQVKAKPLLRVHPPLFTPPCIRACVTLLLLGGIQCSPILYLLYPS